MRAFSLASLLVGVVSGAALSNSNAVSYDGYKVVRLPVGPNASKLTEIISTLGLSTWKGAPRANSFADIVVSPSQAAAFEEATADYDAVVMHEDLGASIAAESSEVDSSSKHPGLSPITPCPIPS